MLARQITFVLAISSFAYGASASAQPRTVGFGPPVSGDATLGANLGFLRQKVAWLNSASSDVFTAVLAKVDDESFDNVVMLSGAISALGRWENIHDDATLERSSGALAQIIAWRNSPAGDAFLTAQAEPMVSGADFERVALASVPGPGSTIVE